MHPGGVVHDRRARESGCGYAGRMRGCGGGIRRAQVGEGSAHEGATAEWCRIVRRGPRRILLGRARRIRPARHPGHSCDPGRCRSLVRRRLRRTRLTGIGHRRRRLPGIHPATGFAGGLGTARRTRPGPYRRRTVPRGPYPAAGSGCTAVSGRRGRVIRVGERASACAGRGGAGPRTGWRGMHRRAGRLACGRARLRLLRRWRTRWLPYRGFDRLCAWEGRQERILPCILSATHTA